MKKQIFLRLITFDILVKLLVAAFDNGVFAWATSQKTMTENRPRQARGFSRG